MFPVILPTTFNSSLVPPLTMCLSTASRPPLCCQMPSLPCLLATAVLLAHRRLPPPSRLFPPHPPYPNVSVMSHLLTSLPSSQFPLRHHRCHPYSLLLLRLSPHLHPPLPSQRLHLCCVPLASLFDSLGVRLVSASTHGTRGLGGPLWRLFTSCVIFFTSCISHMCSYIEIH